MSKKESEKDEGINDRIHEILDEKDLSFAQAAKILAANGYKFSYAQLKNMTGSSRFGVDKLLEFLSVFDDYDANWVLFGTGDKYKGKNYGLSLQAQQQISELKKELEKKEEMLAQLDIQDIRQALALQSKMLKDNWKLQDMKALQKEVEYLKRENELLRRTQKEE